MFKSHELWQPEENYIATTYRWDYSNKSPSMFFLNSSIKLHQIKKERTVSKSVFLSFQKMCLLLNFGQNLAFSWDVWVWKHQSLFCAAISFFWEILSIHILAMKHEYHNILLQIPNVPLKYNCNFGQIVLFLLVIFWPHCCILD